MLLVVAVESFALDAGIHCRVAAGPDCPFVVDGQLPALVSIEFFAQAAGAFFSLRALELGLQPQPGALFGVSQTQVECDVLPVGEEMYVFAKDVWADERSARFDCTLTWRGERIARGAINVGSTATGG